MARSLTFGRYLRLWRELNAITLKDICDITGFRIEKVRNFDINPTNEIIMQTYVALGLKIEDYEKARLKYENKYK